MKLPGRLGWRAVKHGLVGCVTVGSKPCATEILSNFCIDAPMPRLNERPTLKGSQTHGSRFIRRLRLIRSGAWGFATIIVLRRIRNVVEGADETEHTEELRHAPLDLATPLDLLTPTRISRARKTAKGKVNSGFRIGDRACRGAAPAEPTAFGRDRRARPRILLELLTQQCWCADALDRGAALARGAPARHGLSGPGRPFAPSAYFGFQRPSWKSRQPVK